MVNSFIYFPFVLAVVVTFSFLLCGGAILANHHLAAVMLMTLHLTTGHYLFYAFFDSLLRASAHSGRAI